MKFSLKEFFLHESAGDQWSGPKSSQNSSSEKDRKANEAVRPNAQDKRISAAAKAWKPSPEDKRIQRLAKRNQKRIDADSKWQDDEANEGTLKEYEDPTSSKNTEPDSKWSSPYAKQERMPHEEPQNDSQQNSSQGWEEMRSSSEEGHGPGGHYDKKSKIKDFFGGDTHPKSSSKNGKSSKKSSKKMSEAQGEEKWPGNITFEDPDAPESDKEPDISGGTGMPGGVSDSDKYLPGGVDIPTGDDESPEIPMGDMDQFGTGFGEDEYEHDLAPGAKDPYEMSPEELRKWAGSDDSPIEKSFMYDDQPQFGKNPHEFDWTQTTAFNDDEPIRAHEGVDEASDDLSSDEEDFLKSLEGDSPKSPPKADEPEIDWSALDDQGFIDQLSAMEPAFSGPKTRSQKAAPTPSDQFSWDEFRATHPDEAAEAELNFSPDSLKGATFAKKKSGFMTAKLKDGRRLLYMGDGRGWFDMDDEGSPTGEF